MTKKPKSVLFIICVIILIVSLIWKPNRKSAVSPYAREAIADIGRAYIGRAKMGRAINDVCEYVFAHDFISEREVMTDEP